MVESGRISFMLYIACLFVHDCDCFILIPLLPVVYGHTVCPTFNNKNVHKMNCINTSSEEGTSHFPVGSFKRPDCWLRLCADYTVDYR